MINQLIPASANSSDKVRNMVESHMLERSKYEHKLPLLEIKANPKSYPINSHLYYKYNEQAATPNNLENKPDINIDIIGNKLYIVGNFNGITAEAIILMFIKRL